MTATRCSLLALFAFGCSSEPATAPADAAADVAPDASATDKPPTGNDAPAPGDAGACHNFTGGYALVGMCSVPGFGVFPAACITQTGCDARVTVSVGTLNGTVRGDTLTFATMVAGIPLECTAVPAAGGTLTVNCSAAGGAATCTATGTPLSFPGSTATCCSVTGSTCAMDQRCSVVGQGMPVSLLTACVPTGTLAEGAPCERTDGRVGADNCGAGLFCANIGQASATTRVCLRLCQHSGDCGAGSACVVVSDATRAGVCRPTCSLLGTGCATGSCRYAPVYGATDPANAAAVVTPVCGADGTTPAGSPCMFDGECVANHNCTRRSATDTFLCRRVCDRAHACPDGQSCTATTAGTNPDGVGFCVPSM